MPLESKLWRLAGRAKQGSGTVGDVPAELLARLVRTNPRLVDLKERYRHAPAPDQSFWGAWEEQIDLRLFRGEDEYVSQAYYRGTKRRYELTQAYVEATDDYGLLDVLTDDNRFGAKTFELVPGRVVTRDLLDSVLELGFLLRELAWTRHSAVRVLDIGAGYGRFAHRFTTALPRAQVTCTDAVATSTFLSELYLGFRGATRAEVVAFDETDSLDTRRFDLAVNIHSWSECTREFIRFWLRRVADLQVPYLLIVPHTPEFLTKETDGRRVRYFDDIAAHGYERLVMRPKFARSALVQRDGVHPAEYWLFRRV
jgi:SAM-dependent methyltransferase